MVTLETLSTLAKQSLTDVSDGAPLDDLSRALIELGCCVSVCSLDRDAIGKSIEGALQAGATPQQVQEILALISGLGVHSLMVTSPALLEISRQHGYILNDVLTESQQVLWDKYVGDDTFWSGLEQEVPGFLRSMLLLSSDMFEGFFAYCAIPWKTRTVRGITKELVAMASDATPNHRFAPGFRVHLKNAIALGAGRLAILETLQIAAASPSHTGTN
jgi:alkylhydroperoxidase/carboxymuconolactone decarboxylase family protein YurZ